MRRLTDPERLGRFMRRLAEEARAPGRLYFTGGATAVLLGFRSATVDVDVKLEGEAERLLVLVPRIKEELELNVELAAPSDFIPELPGWRERSQWIGREGLLDFFHYDFYAQALAKLERAHVLDLADVQALLDHNLIERASLGRLFAAIAPELYRYPAIDPRGFRRRVEDAVGSRLPGPA